MAVPPSTVLPMDEDTLLRVATLALASDLDLRVPYPGRVLVQHRPTRRHLVLTPPQWAVLQSFAEGRTVPAVLKHLIHERACIPLRDFYELVLQARAAGVLHVQAARSRDTSPPPVSPPAWRRSLDGRLGRSLAGLMLLALPPLLLLNPLAAPTHLGWWALGWLFTCLAVSAGHALAACALHGADLEVHRPRFVLRCLLPRFTADLGDAVLGGPSLRLDCALLRLAPGAGLLALALLWSPDLALPLFCGFLGLLCPLWNSPGLDILRALWHPPRLSVSRGFHFGPNRTLLRRLQNRLSPAEVRFTALRLAGSVLWLAVVALVWSLVRPADAVALLERIRRDDLAALTPLALLAALLLGLLALLACAAFALGARAAARLAAWRRRRADERALSTRPPPDAADTLAFLGETYPFTLLPPEPRRLAAEAMTATLHAPGEIVVPADDRRAALRLLYSGRLAITRPDGTPSASGGIKLRPGALFGESVLLRERPGPAAIRADAPAVVLTLEAEAYRRHVAPHVPADKLEDAAQKMAFLRDIPLCRHWRAPVLAALARRAHIQTFAAGTTLLEDGRENTFFHVIEEGELRVMKEGRRLARLFRGDFFGELSLLRNTVAGADIVAHRPGRCLAVPRQDFLFFLAQDVGIALQFERIASRRLGRPVFEA